MKSFMKWGSVVAVAFAAALVLVIGAVGARAWFVSPMMASGQAGGGGGGGAATASLSASPSSIVSGASSTLTWGSTGAVSCISPGSLGNTAIPSFTGATSGSVSTGALTTTTTYSIQCGPATAAASATVTISGGGGTFACNTGPTSPSPTGVAAADVTTAGFTTCAFNSDFSNSLFLTQSNWLRGCGAIDAVMFWNNAPADGGTVPCSDIKVITDPDVPANGQILDLVYTQADINANITAVNLQTGYISGPGTIFPNTGFYIEFKSRWRANSTTACLNNTSTVGCDMQGDFVYVPPGSATGSFIEWDFDETFMFNTAHGGVLSSRGANGGGGISYTSSPVFSSAGSGNRWWCTSTSIGDPTGGTQCGSAGGNVDITVMHTYGILITNDGNNKTSECLYFDPTPGSYVKLGCYNLTSVSPGAATFATRVQALNQIGPGSGHAPANQFTLPAEKIFSYFRIFSCPNWNSPSGNPQSGNACSGTLVTN